MCNLTHDFVKSQIGPLFLGDCPGMCSLHLQILLQMASLWPIIFLGGTTDALRWAHYIGGCCCQLLHFGPLFFWEVLPMHSDGPIASVDAAANCFTWAHCISRYCC